MENNSQCNIQYIPYKEIVKQKALEYYHKNKEKIKEKNKNKDDLISPEEKRNDKNLIKNGLKNNVLKGNKNLKKKQSSIIK